MGGPLEWLVRIAYDGTGFHGCTPHGALPTIGSVLTRALSRVGEPGASLDFLSRTDAGVHARAQVVRVGLSRPWDPPALLRALGAQLPDTVRPLQVATIEGPLVVKRKTYRYTLDQSPSGDPMLAPFSWRPPGELDFSRLVRSSALFIGARDYGGFSRRGETRTDMSRLVEDVRWHRSSSGEWFCDITGPAFVYRQVRSMVGAMVAVSRGSESIEGLEKALCGVEDGAGRQQAPARGLCLQRMEVQGAGLGRWWGWSAPGRTDPAD